MNPENSYTQWQEQWKKADVGASEPINQVFLEKLEKENTRARWNNRAKIAALAAIMTFMAAQLAIHAHDGMARQLPIGMGVIAASAVLFFFLVRRHQFRLERLDLGLPALGFIRQVLAQLPAEYDYIRRRLPLFIAWVALVGNLMLSGTWTSKMGMSQIVRFHIGFTLFLVFSAWVGFTLRKKRFERHTHPLITELGETLRSWSTEKA